MKRIGIVVPDGVGIKNYLYSDVLKELLKNNVEVLLLHSLSDKALKEVDKRHDYTFKKKEIPKYKESKRSKFYRELISLSRLRFNLRLTNNSSLLDNWNPSKSSLFHKAFYFLINILSLFFYKKYTRIIWLEKKHQNSIKISGVQTLFKDENLDVIFCTHQRSLDAIPVFKKAQELNIKTVGAIFSWDNLPKARLSVRSNIYVVWSTFMKNEMKMFYPEIDQKDIIVTGTPQFEFYNKEELLLSRNDFFKEHGLDKTKKIICFSGDDERTSPYDPLYLEDLAKEINSLPKEHQPQIFFRRCPVDLSGRYDKIVKKYTNIIKDIPPLWNFDTSKDWNLVYPKYEDVKMLVNIAYHTDAVINVGSTMAHDFSVFNKPAIYINYDAKKDIHWSVNTIYSFQHFRSMPDNNAVYWLNSKKEILSVADKALINQEKLTNKEWFNVIVEDYQKASRNISNVLID